MTTRTENDGADSRVVSPGAGGIAELGADLRRDPQDYSATLRIATGGRNEIDTSTQVLDGQNGPPVIVGDGAACRDANGNGKNDVTATVSQDGRVVREKMECGVDNVVAYDDKGQAHRFADNPITKLPVDFSSIPDWRLKQVTDQADGLINKYKDGKTPDGKPDGKISFNDISNIMTDIGKMENLTEVEKCRLWSEVRNKLQSRDVSILDKDEKTEMIDSWKGSDDPWHALITMDDGYHANRLINMSPEDASKAIQDHENGGEVKDMPFPRSLLWRGAYLWYGQNTGDVNASEGQLSALRELRSKGTFSAYAQEWTRQFVRPEIDQYGRPR